MSEEKVEIPPQALRYQGAMQNFTQALGMQIAAAGSVDVVNAIIQMQAQFLHIKALLILLQNHNLVDKFEFWDAVSELAEKAVMAANDGPKIQIATK